MKYITKEIFITAIKEYPYDELIYYSSDSLFNKLKENEINTKKILINNEYGLISNILYDYQINNIEIEKDIMKYILEKDRIIARKICKDYASYSKLYKELKNDKEILLNSIENNGWSFFYTDDSLKNDKELVLTAIKKQASVYQAISENLKNDKDIVLELVKKDGNYLKKISNDLKNDIDIVYNAFLNLKYIPQSFEYTNIEDLYYEASKKVVEIYQIKFEEMITFYGEEYMNCQSINDLIKYMSKELIDSCLIEKIIIYINNNFQREMTENLSIEELIKKAKQYDEYIYWNYPLESEILKKYYQEEK